MKKLFLYVCLSLFVISNFSEAMAMNPAECSDKAADEHKQNEALDADDWGFFEALQFEIRKPKSFLDGSIRLEFQRLDYDKNFDNALIHYHFYHKGVRKTLLFYMQEKKANVLVRWTVCELIATHILTEMDITQVFGTDVNWTCFVVKNCTKEDIKTFKNLYLSTFLNQYLQIIKNRKIDADILRQNHV